MQVETTTLDFRDGKFELTLRTNFFQLKEDLGDREGGFEEFAGIKRNGWWANGANYLFWAQLYHLTNKLDHFTLRGTATRGVERQNAPSSVKRQKRNADNTRRGVIYKLTCRESRMSYIGQTLRNVRCRLAEHHRATTLIGAALRNYGMNSFDIEILMVVDAAVDIDLEEAYYIITHNTVTPHGYNGSVGNNQMHANEILEKHRQNSNQTLMTHPSTFTEDDLREYLESSSSTGADAAASRPERASALKSVHPDKTGQGSAVGDEYFNAIKHERTHRRRDVRLPRSREE